MIRNPKLEDLIPLYAHEKEMETHYKKTSKDYNERIKEKFDELAIDNFTSCGFTVKLVTQERSTLNDEKVIDRNDNSMLAEDLEAMGIIKTKKYVDLDELENAVYKGDLSQSTLDIINDCFDTKTIKTLKLSKAKEI